MKKIIYLLPLVLFVLSCSTKTKSFIVDTSKPHLKIIFSFDSSSYPWLMGTKYPQMAVWVKDSSGTVRTIFVTESAAKKEWIGSKDRPSSVPVWYGISKNKEQKIDALTGATPAGSSYEIKWQVPGEMLNKKLTVYIEANVSFDYNGYYQKEASTDSPGFSDVNGQPSLVWKSDLKAGSKDITVKPELYGHGQVLGKDHQIYKDMSRITTAKKLFHYIKIIYTNGK